MAVQMCYNRGCGKEYNIRQNFEDSCRWNGPKHRPIKNLAQNHHHNAGIILVIPIFTMPTRVGAVVRFWTLCKCDTFDCISFFLRTNQQTSPLSWTRPAVLWASTAMWSRSTPRRSRATWTRSQNLWWLRQDLLFSLKVKSGSAIQIWDDNHRKQKFFERCMKNDDFQFIPAAPRPSYDTPMTRLEPTVAASLKQVRSNFFVL